MNLPAASSGVAPPGERGVMRKMNSPPLAVRFVFQGCRTLGGVRP